MAAITPNGDIYLLKNVPFNQNYNHSIHFASKDEQIAYMTDDSRVCYHLDKQNYVKSESGKIRIQGNDSGKGEDICYMVWNNPDIGSGDAKWVFAFITNVELVSPNVLELSYTVDVLQTYAIQYDKTSDRRIEFKKCLIERETPRKDTPGLHIEPEGLNLEDYVLDNEDEFFDGDYKNWKVIVYSAYSYAEGENYVSQGIAGGLPQGVVANVFNHYDNDDPTDKGVKQWLDDMSRSTNYATFKDSIIGIVTLPFIQRSGKAMLKEDTQSIHEKALTKYQSDDTTLDGYKPKYKKLLTYPFNYMHIITPNSEHDYPYEYFSTDSQIEDDNPSSVIKFNTYTAFSPKPEIMAVPQNYRGLGENFEESMVLSTFPEIPYAISGYNQWKTMTGIKEAMAFWGTLAGSIKKGSSFGKEDSFLNVGGSGGAIAGGTMGAAAGVAVGSIAAIGTNIYERLKGIPNAVSMGSSTASQVAGRLSFYSYQKCLRKRTVKRLDYYFDMYGYSVSQIETPTTKIPNTWGDEKQTHKYIKTSGCLVVGDCPSEYCRQIENIFNNGVTWWKKNKVGEYVTAS